MERQRAFKEVEAHAGNVLNSISKKANFLVVGMQDPNIIRGQYSTKHMKALELKNKGCPIEIVDENTFLDWLFGESLDLLRVQHEPEAIISTYEELFNNVYNACPEKDHPFITMNLGKDTKYMSISFYHQLALRFMLGKKISHVDLDGEYHKNMEGVCTNQKLVDSESGQKLRLYIDASFHFDTFLAQLPAICADYKVFAPVESFGCCSLYVECSDARECLRWRDEEYLGCAYRRNLESGRIFYGQNANIK
jgi:hypothetical protein